MNIKRSGKGSPIHKMRAGGRDSTCGLLWRDSRVNETTEEVTCKHCLKIMEKTDG